MKEPAQPQRMTALACALCFISLYLLLDPARVMELLLSALPPERRLNYLVGNHPGGTHPHISGYAPRLHFEPFHARNWLEWTRDNSDILVNGSRHGGTKVRTVLASNRTDVVKDPMAIFDADHGQGHKLRDFLQRGAVFKNRSYTINVMRLDVRDIGAPCNPSPCLRLLSGPSCCAFTVARLPSRLF